MLETPKEYLDLYLLMTPRELLRMLFHISSLYYDIAVLCSEFHLTDVPTSNLQIPNRAQLLLSRSAIGLSSCDLPCLSLQVFRSLPRHAFQERRRSLAHLALLFLSFLGSTSSLPSYDVCLKYILKVQTVFLLCVFESVVR
jgi:hypothetical protein